MLTGGRGHHVQDVSTGRARAAFLSSPPPGHVGRGTLPHPVVAPSSFLPVTCAFLLSALTDPAGSLRRGLPSSLLSLTVAPFQSPRRCQEPEPEEAASPSPFVRESTISFSK